MGFWKSLLDAFYIVEMIADIPVIGHAPDVFRRLGIVQHHLGPLIHHAAVMIPDHDLPIPKTLLRESGPKVVFYKIPLFLGGVDAGFPDLVSHRFVLNRHAPDWNPF